MRGSQGAMDHLNHRVELRQNLGIPKPKYLVPLALEKWRPSSILLIHLRMLTAIEFDHQVMLHTTEIGDEGGNRVLAAKLGPSALATTEAMPQPTLGVGLIVAQATSVCDQPRHDRGAEMISPSPCPSPPGRGDDCLRLQNTSP